MSTLRLIRKLLSRRNNQALFVDHSFHKKTHSTDFIPKLLSREFSLEVVYDENWRDDRPAKVKIPNSTKYLFYCQVLPEIEDLKKQTKNKKIIWFPMYDAVITGMNKKYLKNLAKLPMKVICFSRTLFNIFKKAGFNGKYIQYYIDPKGLHGSVADSKKKNIYFWYRREPINWIVVKKLIGKCKVASITLKNDPDPGFKPIEISASDRNKYKITIYNDYLREDKYHSLLNRNNIYIASRPLEGIGISFIEALARGQCVIAPDSPTMDEYIKNGVNGYLYNISNPKPIDLANFANVAKKARKKALLGFENWQSEEKKILSFIKS